DPLFRFQRITLSTTDGFILSRVDGVLTAREILKITPVEAAEAERALLGLLCIGMVEAVATADAMARMRPPSPEELRSRVLELHASLATCDHFQVLGLTPAATPAEVEAAYCKLAKLFHPDAHHEAPLLDLQAQIEAVFVRLAEARRVLADPTLRAR